MFRKKHMTFWAKQQLSFARMNVKINYQKNPRQAGVQIGNACWELYCLEHGIDKDGNMPTDAVS